MAAILGGAQNHFLRLNPPSLLLSAEPLDSRLLLSLVDLLLPLEFFSLFSIFSFPLFSDFSPEGFLS